MLWPSPPIYMSLKLSCATLCSKIACHIRVPRIPFLNFNLFRTRILMGFGGNLDQLTPTDDHKEDLKRWECSEVASFPCLRNWNISTCMMFQWLVSNYKLHWESIMMSCWRIMIFSITNIIMTPHLLPMCVIVPSERWWRLYWTATRIDLDSHRTRSLKLR